MAMEKKGKTILGASVVGLGAMFGGLYSFAKRKRKDAIYANELKQKNPFEGKKVILIENQSDPENADGVRGHLEAIGESNYSPGIYEKYVKRALDIISSFGGLIVLSPIFLGIAIAIKIDDPGPIFFTQKRIGKNKQYFKLHKFRTMKMETPHDVPTHMLEDPDQYITKVGKFLRASSLDELPQIWDIFMGTLSWIGPRPALWSQEFLLAERDKYDANDVCPGLTGWAQINGRDELEIEEKAKYDGEYVKKIGFLMDLKCVLGTIGSVLNSDGVVEGGTGEMHKKKIDVEPNITFSAQTVKKNICIGAAISSIGITAVIAGFRYLSKRSHAEKNCGKKRWKLIVATIAGFMTARTVIVNYNAKKKLNEKIKVSKSSPQSERKMNEHKKNYNVEKKILITGKGSYIGTSVRDWLYASEGNYQVDELDMLDSKWKSTDFSSYDVVYHVAGIAHADTGHVTEEDKRLYYQVNTNLAVEVAEKAKMEGVGQFIFMSSMIVYSGCREKHITKMTEPKPLNFYGDSKWQADQKIRAMEADDFKVVVIRPPMIYGKGSKGNYPKLAKLATKVPIFPVVKNQRSMLHIDNLCEFVKLMIDREERGVFFPQNAEYVNTTELVQMIAKIHHKPMLLLPFTGMLTKIMEKIPGKMGNLSEKVFGDSFYDLSMSEYKENYRVCDFAESIRKTENISTSNEQENDTDAKKKEGRNILVISQYFYPEEFRINDICKEWVKRGYHVTVVTGIPNYPQGEFFEGYDYEHKRTETWNGIDVIRLPIKPRKSGKVNLALNYFSFVKEGYRWVKKTKIQADRVFIYEVSPMTQALVGVWYAKKFHAKCLLYVTDLWPENVEIVLGIHNRLFLGTLGKMVDYIYKRCDYILTSSKSFINKIEKRGVSKEKLRFWPQYAEEFYKKTERKENIGIPDDGVVNLTFAGNIGTAQGLDVLVETAKLLKKEEVLVRFNMIGNGRYKEQLRQNIQDADVTEFFNFIPRQPAERIPEYFAWSDAALITLDKSEVYAMTIPAKTQSCLACGMPIIVSADGEVQKIIQEAKCGFYNNSGDGKALMENIKKFIRLSEVERKKMADNAVNYYRKHFDKKNLMNKMEDYLQ